MINFIQFQNYGEFLLHQYSLSNDTQCLSVSVWTRNWEERTNGGSEKEMKWKQKQTEENKSLDILPE